MSTSRRTRLGQLRVVPVSYRTACAFVRAHHRHHGPPQGHKFSIGLVAGDGDLVGVAMVGRPVARHLDDGCTAELTRLCTDSTRNACSALLAAAWRTARCMGYQRMITYTRQDEPGTSLRAAGWRPLAARPARPGWDRPSRPRPPTGTEHTARTLWQVSVADTRRRHTQRIPSPTPDEVDRHADGGEDGAADGEGRP